MKAIIATTVMGIVMMYAGIVMKERKGLATLAAGLLVILLGVNIWELMMVPTDPAKVQYLFTYQLHIDRFAQCFNTLITACTLLYVLLAGREILKVGERVAEYFALIFFILCGVYLLSGYNSLLMLFLGIEIISIPQYILAGSDRKNLKSSEASLKYFLMGAFSTGILLMGIALLYGATGTFLVDRFNFPANTAFNPLALGGILLLLVSFGFKVSAAPMHFWTPDVYDGSPAPFTAYMATVVKAAGFYAFLRLFHNSFGELSDKWTMVLAVVTAATLFVGNITAVFQQSVKRMLAYSSIAQAGFMLFSILGNGPMSTNSMILYGVAYTIATIGLFSVMMKLKDYTYDGFNGLAKKEPLLAFAATVFVLSLTGIPLTAGFMAKYYVLVGLVNHGGMMWLVIFGLLMAAISAYYYFRVIMAIYFKQGNPELHEPVAGGDKFLLILTVILVLAIGIFPQLILGML